MKDIKQDLFLRALVKNKLPELCEVKEKVKMTVYNLAVRENGNNVGKYRRVVHHYEKASHLKSTQAKSFHLWMTINSKSIATAF